MRGIFQKLTSVVWIGLSLPIDFLLMLIPLRILKRSNIQGRERRILKWVFCATLLGTITWYDRLNDSRDLAANRSTALVEYTGHTKIGRLKFSTPSIKKHPS